METATVLLSPPALVLPPAANPAPVAPAKVRALPEDPAQTRTALKILSWNIYMLPRFAKLTGKRRRARAIAETLKQLDYDTIVFQEAFLSEARRIIRRHLAEQYPHETGPANRGLSLRTNSGIWILSKYPFRVVDELTFIAHQGIDSMARKGATLIEACHEGIHFQILGTHLNAYSAANTRRKQCVQIAEMLARHARPGVPQLLAGDMNVEKADTENYHHMLQTLQAQDGELSGPQQSTEDGLLNDMTSVSRDSRNVIDYILYRGNGHQDVQIQRTIPVFRLPWSNRKKDLSDHYPVELKIRL